MSALSAAQEEIDRLNSCCYVTLDVGISQENKDAMHLHKELDVAVILTRLGRLADEQRAELSARDKIIRELEAQAQPLGYVCGQHMGPREKCPVCELEEVWKQIEANGGNICLFGR